MEVYSSPQYYPVIYHMEILSQFQNYHLKKEAIADKF